MGIPLAAVPLADLIKTVVDDRDRKNRPPVCVAGKLQIDTGQLRFFKMDRLMVEQDDRQISRAGPG